MVLSGIMKVFAVVIIIKIKFMKAARVQGRDSERNLFLV